jgi:hypothetical protein
MCKMRNEIAKYWPTPIKKICRMLGVKALNLCTNILSVHNVKEA